MTGACRRLAWSWAVSRRKLPQAASGATLFPKEGGNTFKGFLSTAYSNQNFQSNNLTPDLQALGLRAVDKLRKVWDVNRRSAARYFKDKLWFQSSVRNWGVDNLAAGIYYDLTPTAFVYTPDFTRRASMTSL